MDKHGLAAHLYALFVPLEKGDDETTTWQKVHFAWAGECEKLGFQEEAQYYRQKAEAEEFLGKVARENGLTKI